LEETAIRAASNWFVRAQRGLTRDEQADFLAWMEALPENLAAMDLIARSWDLSGQAAKSETLSSQLRRAQSLSLIGVHGVRRDRGPAIRRAVGAGAGTVAAALLVVVVWNLFCLDLSYTTLRGRQESVALPDGTDVQLDAATKLHVRFTPFYRHVFLAAGEAEFDVADHDLRPFRLDTQYLQVQDLGTRFTVRSREGSLRVVLIHGSVELRDSSTGKLRAKMVPGQQATITGKGGEVIVAAADLPSVLAWRDGQLVLKDAPLDEVLREFSARATADIVLSEPESGRLRVSGVYRIADVIGFLNTLCTIYPLSWREIEPTRFQLSAQGHSANASQKAPPRLREIAK
jgi:transmembrane sensor